MSVLSASRLPFFAAASFIALSGCLGASAHAQARPDLDAMVYGGATSAPVVAQQPTVVMQQPQQPVPRGLFTSMSASNPNSSGAIAAIGGIFKRTPRPVAPQPMEAQAAMTQPAQSSQPQMSQAQMAPAQMAPAQMAPAPLSPRNDLDMKAYGAPAYSPPPETPSESATTPPQRGLLTGSKFAPASSGNGALAALGKGFRRAPRGDYAPAPVQARYAPQPIPMAPPVYDQTYRVDAGDRLRIVIYGQDGLTNTYQIGASGSITMPLIGGVPARGRTPAELAGAITGRLRDGFIRDPSVAVEIEAYRPFFILGEVAAPGQYPYVPHMSVESAVAIAGGFSPRAKRDRVTLTHSMPEGLLRAVVPTNTPLSPGDTIMVGERWF